MPAGAGLCPTAPCLPKGGEGMEVAVGSTNPLKVKAVERAFPLAKVVGVSINPAVSHTPTSIEEMIAGAEERAKKAREVANANLGVGIEGGLYKAKGRVDRWFLTAFAALWDGEVLAVGHGFGIAFPEEIAREVGEEELGVIMDRLYGKEGTKHAEGAVGILSKGYLLRQEMLESAVRAAIAHYRFLLSKP